MRSRRALSSFGWGVSGVLFALALVLSVSDFVLRWSAIELRMEGFRVGFRFPSAVEE